MKEAWHKRHLDNAPPPRWCVARQLQGLVAPMVLEGAINGTAFLAWVKQELVPQLKPGDVVVMDNLQPHNAPNSWSGLFRWPRSDLLERLSFRLRGFTPHFQCEVRVLLHLAWRQKPA